MTPAEYHAAMDECAATNAGLREQLRLRTEAWLVERDKFRGRVGREMQRGNDLALRLNKSEDEVRRLRAEIARLLEGEN